MKHGLNFCKPLSVLTAFILLLLFSVSISFAGQVNKKQILNAGIESPFVKVVKEIRNSVVHITCLKDKRSRSPYFYRRHERGYYTGSGVIFKKTGKKVYILTNNHVVDKAKTIDISMYDGTKFEAEMVGGDDRTDIAVISFETNKKVNIAKFGDSDKTAVGAWAIAIGSPFTSMGRDWTMNVLDRTVTVGVISGKKRSNMNLGRNTPVFQNYIQTDASINPGNSGGPLLDIHGRVIGINTFMINPGSGGNVGLGFAIPINNTKRVITDLIKHGRVIRAYIGFIPQKIDEDLKIALGLKSKDGVLVVRVTDDTPAGKAGMEKGDIIIGFNGKKIKGVDAFRMMVANSEIEKDVKLKVMRKSEEKILTVTLKENQDNKIVAHVNLPESSNWLGIKVSRDKADEVMVVGIEPYSAAERSNLFRGDIILEINNQQVKDWDDFKEISKELKDKKVVVLYIKRGRKNLYLAIRSH